MPKHGLHYLVAALFLAVALNLPAAPKTGGRTSAPYTIDKWDTDTDEALPNNEVLAITQTRDGYLWLGTLNGLVRFDGMHFTVFDESTTPGLNSSRIVQLFEDSHGILWIGTETAGVAALRDGQITSPAELGFGGPERRLRSVCEDSNGAVWFCNENGDLWRYWHGSFRPFLPPNRDVRYKAVVAEKSGTVWVVSDQGQSALGAIGAESSLILPLEPNLEVSSKKLSLLLASRNGGYWRLADGEIKRGTNLVETRGWAYPWNALVGVSCACEDPDGNLLVGTAGGGVFWFKAEGGSTSISTNEGLSNNHILSLYFDHEGDLWVGTDGGGLNRVKRKVFDVLEGTEGLTVQSVCEDREGSLWMAFTTEPNGVARLKDGALQEFGHSHGFYKAKVWSVFADRNTNIWAGALGGLYLFRDGFFQRLPLPEAFAIHQDRSNRLWFGTRGALVNVIGNRIQTLTTSNGLSPGVVRALADDSEGNLWIGTAGGGLNRLRNGQFTRYHKSDGVPSENISSLYVDEDGVFWVGTAGSGLGRLQNGKWTHYTKQEGLISNSIGYLLEDGQGYLWIGSNRGLMRVKKKALNDFAAGLITSLPLRAYGTADGLPTSECTSGCQPGACRTRDGTLWFPTIKGLVSVNPLHLLLNTNPPPVIIESVLIDGQPQNTNALRSGWTQEVTIPAGKERLEIHFTSLNLAAPERARFRYRLEGHESTWTEASGNVRFAKYTKLDPGHYRFRVTACNEDEVWNQAGSSFAVIIAPPIWKTWWFLSTGSVCLLGAISGVVYYVSTQKLQRQLERLRQQEALEKERARIARDIHDQLGASLTQVSLLGEFVESDKDSPAEVEAHARQICQTARDTTRVLDEIVWTVNPSNDTLEGLINYICKYAQDYLTVAGLRYRLDIPAQLPAAAIPPELRHNVFLAAKEAVTNIVRHAKASAARLRLKLEPRSFTLEIEDNGRGPGDLDAQSAQSRNGLRNMRKRMEDSGGTFSISAAPEGGTVVRLTAPLPSL